MRCASLAATLLVFASVARASGQDAAVPPPVTGVMLPVPQLPSIGLPLPHIGLPDPPATKKPSSSGDEQGDGSAPPARQGRRRSGVPPVVVYAPVIVGGTTTQTPGVPTATAPAAATRTGRTGTLALTAKDDDPRFLVFVDGVYVGACDELDGTLTLTPGTHDVQLQADGRPARRFTVRIAAGKTTTHDTDLAGEDERLAEAGRPHTAGPGSHEVAGRSQDVADSGHIYIIAGCYAGNVPPVAATLPAGCDAARLTTLAR